MQTNFLLSAFLFIHYVVNYISSWSIIGDRTFAPATVSPAMISPTRKIYTEGNDWFLVRGKVVFKIRIRVRVRLTLAFVMGAIVAGANVYIPIVIWNFVEYQMSTLIIWRLVQQIQMLISWIIHAYIVIWLLLWQVFIIRTQFLPNPTHVILFAS